MNKKGKFLALAMTLTLSVTSVFAVGCRGHKKIPGTSSSITLDKENLSLDAGRSEKLSASSAEVDWKTSDPGVATVDENGNVTGVNEGTCKITASTKDGKFESECVVVVSGYRLSKNVVSGINKIENNTYNGEINYVVNGSDDDAFVVSYDGSAITDLTQRTRPSGDAPMMCRAYKPTEEKAFAVGKHNAKIRSKNSAGVSEWKEFTFTVAASSQEEAETFRGITGHGNNQWNATKDFYTATINDDKTVKIGFTAAATDEWSTYLFNFDTATIEATKLHIKVRLVSGDLEKVRYQVDGANGTVYGEDLVFDSDGVAELTIDVESTKLASSYGSVMLFLNKYATAGETFEIEIEDVSLF